ncbi:hypothetical protein QFC21_002866 [Naganishia friedmannii]|uniref:Uncharacterized protein n=1 Tax=Naganishia friedmannii TaxID=89922 RepID=A0ACC2VUK4_9TREE|nr:hypothetical protein QFC21_002866 [Naganishia friedmannii]
MSKPSSRRAFRKPNHNALGLAGALGEDGGNSDGDIAENAEENSSRAQRFATNLEGNRFRELEQSRMQERKLAIAQGLIADPDKPTSLEDAIEFVGQCTEMCPLFEREEREYKKNVHPLEQKEGQPGRIDPAKAVTMYHRSAAGIDQPLPSDVRTPATLKRTLDYLFYHVMTTQPPDLSEPPTPLSALRYTHGFIRDRTRGIRQDFTYQRHVGIAENIECHERIARFHILAIHEMARLEDAQFLKQEAEQLNKTLISLIELYDDQRLDGRTCSNEPEFRAYQLLSHLNDNEVARTILDLPQDVFNHPYLQLAFTFRALAQRNFDSQKVGSKYNAEISLNFFTRFFKRAKKSDVPFLMACLAHNKFGDIRRAGVRALMRAYPAPPQGLVLRNGDDPANARVIPTGVFMKLLQCETEAEAMAIADALGVEPYYPRGIDGLDPSETLGFLVNTSADFDDNGDAPPAAPSADIENKRFGATYQDVIDGKLAHPKQSRTPHSMLVEPRARVHSKIASSNPSSGIKAMPPSTSRPVLAAGGPSFSFSSSLNATASSFQPSPFAFQSTQAPGPSTIQTAERPPSSFSIPKETAFNPRPSAVPSMPNNGIPTSNRSTFTPLPLDNAFGPRPLSLSTATTDRPKTPAQDPASDVVLNRTAKVTIQSPDVQLADPPTMPSSRKRPSQALVDSLAKRLTSEAMVTHVKATVHRVTDDTITLEQVHRQKLYAKKQLQRRTQVESVLCERILIQMAGEIIREEAADAYGEEMWELPLRQRSFTWWRSKARSRAERRERDLDRAARRSEYKKHIQSLVLGTSLSLSQNRIDPADGETPTSWAPDDVDQDATISLRKLSKRKAILHEGTFFSVLSSYVCNLSRTDENDPIHLDAMQEHIDWHVVVAATQLASGTWLRSKFNVRNKEGYTADYHGECRNATVTALANPSSIPISVGLVVFECSQDAQEDQTRFANLMADMPARPLYQPGLLIIQWQDRTEASLLSTLKLNVDTLPFDSFASVNMAADASDQTFVSALRNALPRMRYQPHFEVSMEDPASSLFGVARELLSFIDYLLLQNIDDPRSVAQLVAAALHIMKKLQNAVLDDILGPLQISTDDYSKITFDCSKANRINDVELDNVKRFLSMIGRSVFECLSDIKTDVTQSERDTLQEITLQAGKTFEEECAKARSKLANFAKLEYEKNRSRPAPTKTEMQKEKQEMDSARYESALDSRILGLLDQRLKSVILQSARATRPSPPPSEQSGKKRSYAAVELVPALNNQHNSPDKRQKPVLQHDASISSGLTRLRDALASARTVLKTRNIA